MLHPKERWIFFYDKVIEMKPEGAPALTMQEIIDDLKIRFDAGECVKLINNSTAAIRISDLKIDSVNSTATLLIQYADMNASDPVFSNLETGELRAEPKLEGEGVAISAHAVISLMSNANDANSYLMLLEDVPGVGQTKLKPFFTSEYRHACDYIFEDEEGAERKCRPLIEMHGHPSQSLRQDLEDGSLQGIELVRRDTTREFDEPNIIKEVSRTVQLKLSRPVRGNRALGIIERARERALLSGFTDIKVKYKKPEGKQRSILLATARQDAADALYTRCELISVNDPLLQCQDGIRDDVNRAMKNMLIRHRQG